MKTTIPSTTNMKELEITIVSKDFELTETIKNKIEEKVSNLNKYSKKEKTAKVKLESVKGTYTVTIIMIVKNKILKSKVSSEDLYKSIDLATENIKNQLSRLPRIPKGKQRHFKKAKKDIILMNVPKGNNPRKRFLQDESIKPMFKEEAKIQMELNGLKNFHYIDGETFKPSVICSRSNKAV